MSLPILGGVQSTTEKYTGFANWKPSLVNPTKEQLKAVTGIDLSNDIVYAGENDNGQPKCRIDIWGEQEQVGWSKISFFVENRSSLYTKQETGDTHGTYVNNQFATCYGFNGAPTGDKFDWFNKPGGVRILNEGEKEIVAFIKSMYGSTGLFIEEFAPVNWPDLCRGNVTELREVISQVETLAEVEGLTAEQLAGINVSKAAGTLGVVEVLFTIKENGFYQGIFNRYVGLANGKSRKTFKNDENYQADKKGKRLTSDFYSHRFVKWTNADNPELADPTGAHVPAGAEATVTAQSAVTMASQVFS